MLVNVQEGGVFFQVFGGRMDDVTRTMSKRGGACECPRVGAFFKLMTSRGQCPRGGACECLYPPPPFRKSCIRAWCSTHPSSDPPPPPTWMAGYGPACTYYSRFGMMANMLSDSLRAIRAYFVKDFTLNRAGKLVRRLG